MTTLLRHFLITVIFAMLAVSPVCVQGQGKVRLHGKITGPDNSPIEFATIRVAGTTSGTTSGLDGNYSLVCSYSDTLDVHFSCIGFREQKRRLIDPREDVTVEAGRGHGT